MENRYFKPAGNIDDERKNVILPKENTEHFTPFKNPQEIVDYFKPAGDIEDESKNVILPKNYNENDTRKGSLSSRDIDDYLLTIVSGKRFDIVCELGVLMGAGRMIVGLEQLKKMVEEGCNIVSANVLNAAADMIEVEYQEYKYDEELMGKRRRF